MRPSRPLLALAVLVAAIGLWTVCGKKGSSPVAPVPTPACSISPTRLDFGSVETGSVSSTKTFSITNSGGGTLSGTVSESCPDFEVASGAGLYDLAAGQSRTVTVRFHPLSAGNKSCAVSTGCAQSVTLVGVASPGLCKLIPATLDFGSVTVGQNHDRTFTLRNSGSATLTGTLTEPCPDFAIQSPPSYTLAAGQSDTFTVRFAPSQPGPQSCVINTGSPGCPQVSCTGTGVPVSPGCQLSVTGLSFPQVGVGDRADASFTLTNAGSTALVGTMSEDCPDFSIPGQASYNLPPGQSQAFIVRFTPSRVGEQTCEVRVGAGCPALSCWGSGVIGCVFQPTSFDFGYMMHEGTRCASLALSNNTSDFQEGVLYARQTAGIRWAGVIRLDGVAISGTNPLLYGLNAGQSRTFSLCWDTQYTNVCDTLFAVWEIRSDNPGCSLALATVRGVITKGCACSVTPTTLDFGNVVVGDTSPYKNVTISNRSGINGLWGRIRVLSGDFLADSLYGCCREGTCAVYVDKRIWFRPMRLGPQTGKIVVENLIGCFGPGASAICDTVTVTGVGITAVSEK